MSNNSTRNSGRQQQQQQQQVRRPSRSPQGPTNISHHRPNKNNLDKVSENFESRKVRKGEIESPRATTKKIGEIFLPKKEIRLCLIFEIRTLCDSTAAAAAVAVQKNSISRFLVFFAKPRIFKFRRIPDDFKFRFFASNPNLVNFF